MLRVHLLWLSNSSHAVPPMSFVMSPYVHRAQARTEDAVNERKKEKPRGERVCWERDDTSLGHRCWRCSQRIMYIATSCPFEDDVAVLSQRFRLIEKTCVCVCLVLWQMCWPLHVKHASTWVAWGPVWAPRWCLLVFGGTYGSINGQHGPRIGPERSSMGSPPCLKQLELGSVSELCPNRVWTMSEPCPNRVHLLSSLSLCLSNHSFIL